MVKTIRKGARVELINPTAEDLEVWGNVFTVIKKEKRFVWLESEKKPWITPCRTCGVEKVRLIK